MNSICIVTYCLLGGVWWLLCHMKYDVGVSIIMYMDHPCTSLVSE